MEKIRKVEGQIIEVSSSESKQNHLKQPEKLVMHEGLKRPTVLKGSTYKVSTPDHISSHSLYITINDIILNEGTGHQEIRPFEIFVNSKSLEHYQWIIALTRIMSAVFRKGGDFKFMIDELRSVFDPKGGYWSKGVYLPSLIAEIGNVIEQHVKSLNSLELGELPAAKKDTKITAISEKTVLDKDPTVNGAWCDKCMGYSVVIKDGCKTCTSCGDSKCG